MSCSLQPRGLKHIRLLCPSLSPRVCSNSCPLSQWSYLTIFSSAVPCCCCPQSFPASGSFPVSQLFTTGGQSTGASASASVLPMNIQGWFPLGLTFILRYINWTCYHFLLSEPITDLVAGMRLHVQSVSPKLKWYMQQLEFFLSLFLSCGE